jgi:hypothetical protein
MWWQVPAGLPVSILWGADDPWEDMREARRLFAHQACVTEFVELPKVGHCPQDEVRPPLCCNTGMHMTANKCMDACRELISCSMESCSII